MKHYENEPSARHFLFESIGLTSFANSIQWGYNISIQLIHPNDPKKTSQSETF